MKVLYKYRDPLWQFFKYGLVGISNAAVSLACFYGLIIFFDIYYLIANIFAFLCGLINSYIWNKYWVFRPDSTNSSNYFRFIVVNVTNFGINSLLLIILVEKLQFSPITAQPIIITITTIFGFSMTKVWVFQKKIKQVTK